MGWEGVRVCHGRFYVLHVHRSRMSVIECALRCQESICRPSGSNIYVRFIVLTLRGDFKSYRLTVAEGPMVVVGSHSTYLSSQDTLARSRVAFNHEILSVYIGIIPSLSITRYISHV